VPPPNQRNASLLVGDPKQADARRMSRQRRASSIAGPSAPAVEIPNNRRAGGVIDISTAQILQLEKSSLGSTALSNMRSVLPFIAW
jgi:hypothetical protein